MKPSEFTELLNETLNAIVPNDGSVGGKENDAVFIKKAGIIHNSMIEVELNTGDKFDLIIRSRTLDNF